MTETPGIETIADYDGSPTDPRLRTDPEAVQALIDNLEQEITELEETVKTATNIKEETKKKIENIVNPQPGETTITTETLEELQKREKAMDEEEYVYRFNIEELQQQLREAQLLLEELKQKQ